MGKTNDYLERVNGIKKEILDEIRNLLKPSGSHKLEDPLFVHMIDGEVATTDICKYVCVREYGEVVFIVEDGVMNKDDIYEGESIFVFDTDSLIYVLDGLKRELRESKIERLRSIVKRNGEIRFERGFLFTGVDAGFDIDNCELTSISALDNGELKIYTKWDGDSYVNDENLLPLEELDRIIDYAERKTEKQFTIRVSGEYARSFDVKACSYEKALEIAKTEWASNPLSQEDSCSEDWDGYKSGE